MFESRLQLPDPRTQVVDWAGAFERGLNTFERGLNTFLKVRQMGLENQWQQKKMELADKKMAMDAADSAANMNREDKRLDMQGLEAAERMRNDNQRTMFAGMAARSKMTEDGLRMRQMGLQLQQQQEEAGAVATNTTNESIGFYKAYDNAAALATTVRDPIQQMAAIEGVKNIGFDPAFKGTVAGLMAKSPRVRADPNMQLRASPVDVMSKAADARIYDSGVRGTTVEIDTDAVVPAGIRALASSNAADWSDAQRAELQALMQTQGQKIRFTDATIKYSLNDLLDGTRMGDEKKAKLFVAYSSDKKAALEKVADLLPAGHNLGNLNLSRDAEAAGVAPELLQKFKAPSRNAGAYIGMIDSLQGSGVKPQDPVMIQKKDGTGVEPAKNDDGTLLTSAQKMGYGLDAMRKEGANPADYEVAKKRFDAWVSTGYDSPQVQQQSGARTEASQIEAAPATDLTLGQLLKRETGHAMQGVVWGLPSDVLKLPQQLKGLWNTPLKNITLDQLNEIPEDIIPPAVKMAARAFIDKALEQGQVGPQGSLPYTTYRKP